MNEQISNRGLSNTNKVLMFDKRSRTYLVLAPKEARLSKMRKRIFAWANAIKSDLSDRRYRKVLITLTYEKVDDWKPNHIRNYIKNIKARLGNNLRALAWCAELQKRGAVHYHIEMIVYKGTRIPLPDKSGMWVHGMSRIETAKTVFYIASYMKKSYQKEGKFPKGLRMYAVYIAKGIISSVANWIYKLSVCPKWLYEHIITNCRMMAVVKRIKRVGWTVDNIKIKSPYALITTNYISMSKGLLDFSFTTCNP